ncbi:MAG: YMGG-like glycine zipper-containing protein [Bdellovibrionota bacterium]
MNLSVKILISLIVTTSFIACSTWNKLDNTEKGAVIGGGSGAVIGSAAGGTAGTIIGGAAGAVGGGLIGREVDDD